MESYVKPVTKIEWSEIDSSYLYATIDETGDIFLHKYPPQVGMFGWESLDMGYCGTIEIPSSFVWYKSIITR